VVIGVAAVIAVVTFVSGINGYVAERVFHLGKYQGRRAKNVILEGDTAAVKSAYDIQMRSGRWFSEIDDTRHAPVIVLGPHTADTLFPTGDLMAKNFRSKVKFSRWWLYRAAENCVRGWRESRGQQDFFPADHLPQAAPRAESALDFREGHLARGYAQSYG
jgi:hypothetical protein